MLDVSSSSSEVSTYIEVGGSRVPMTKADVTAVKALFSSSSASSSSSLPSSDDFVGLKLLGFLPRVALTSDLNIDEPYFLFPNDKAIAGTRADTLPLFPPPSCSPSSCHTR